jgi:hypothetical protein
VTDSTIVQAHILVAMPRCDSHTIQSRPFQSEVVQFTHLHNCKGKMSQGRRMCENANLRSRLTLFLLRYILLLQTIHCRRAVSAHLLGCSGIEKVVRHANLKSQFHCLYVPRSTTVSDFYKWAECIPLNKLKFASSNRQSDSFRDFSTSLAYPHLLPSKGYLSPITIMLQ